MNQEGIVNALGEHMSALQYIVGWAVIIAFGVGWAGLQKKKELEIVGLKVGRREAFYIATLLYLMANLTVLLLLWRIEALLIALNDKYFVRGYTTLALHAWLLNPFGYVGSNLVAALSTSLSMGLIIISWWICITSVVVIRGKQPIIKSVILPVLFYAAGNLSLVSLYRIYGINLARLETLDQTLFVGIKETALGRWIAIWSGTAVGISILIVTLWFQRRASRNPGASKAREET